MKKTGFYGYIYDFSSKYNTLQLMIYQICQELMKHFIYHRLQINLSAKVYVMLDISGILVHANVNAINDVMLENI